MILTDLICVDETIRPMYVIAVQQVNLCSIVIPDYNSFQNQTKHLSEVVAFSLDYIFYVPILLFPAFLISFA